LENDEDDIEANRIDFDSQHTESCIQLPARKRKAEYLDDTQPFFE
jgi:hypothetical protein